MRVWGVNFIFKRCNICECTKTLLPDTGNVHKYCWGTLHYPKFMDLISILLERGNASRAHLFETGVGVYFPCQNFEKLSENVALWQHLVTFINPAWLNHKIRYFVGKIACKKKKKTNNTIARAGVNKFFWGSIWKSKYFEKECRGMKALLKIAPRERKKIQKWRYKATIAGGQGAQPHFCQRKYMYNIFHPEKAISGPFDP